MSFEGFNDRDDSIMTANSQVISLGNVMGQDYSRALSNSGEHREQNSSLQGLGLVNNDERVVKRASANVGQGQDFDQSTIHDLINDGLADQCTQSIEYSLSPRRHLLALTARKVAKFLAADGIERTEDHNLLMVATF